MIIYLVVLLKCLFVVYMFIFYSTSRVFFRIVGDSAMSDEISPSSRTWVYLFNFFNCRQEFAVCIQKWGKTVLHSFYYEDDQTRWRLMENRSSFISHEALVPVSGNSTVIDGFYSVVQTVYINRHLSFNIWTWCTKRSSKSDFTHPLLKKGKK